jgi:hypothetical protein
MSAHLARIAVMGNDGRVKHVFILNEGAVKTALVIVAT